MFYPRHFEHHRFLLGDRPCLADFALAGASKAHFHYRSGAKKLAWRHETMLTRYTEPFFVGDELDAGWWSDDDKLPDTLASILNYFARTYFLSSVG